MKLRSTNTFQKFRRNIGFMIRLLRMYKGDDAFSLLKSRVEQSENSFLVLQQGSRSLSEKLFRKVYDQ